MDLHGVRAGASFESPPHQAPQTLEVAYDLGVAKLGDSVHTVDEGDGHLRGARARTAGG